MIFMKMSKIIAAASAAVMTVLAVPAAEASAYTIEGYYETIPSAQTEFGSVSELAVYLDENGGGVSISEPNSCEVLELMDVDSLWFPVGFSDKADSVTKIVFTEDSTSVEFTLPYSSYTLCAYRSSVAGKYVYDSIKAWGDKQKVDGRTVCRRTDGFVTEYCWKQAGKYFLMSVTGGGSFSDCIAEEYLIPEYNGEGLRNIGGKLYYVQSDGSWYVGWKTVNGRKYFFGMDGAALTKNTIVGNVRYTFDPSGVCTGTYTGWVTKEGYRYYYKKGRYVTGINTISGKTYTFNDYGVLMY